MNNPCLLQTKTRYNRFSLALTVCQSKDTRRHRFDKEDPERFLRILLVHLFTKMCLNSNRLREFERYMKIQTDSFHILAIVADKISSFNVIEFISSAPISDFNFYWRIPYIDYVDD